MKLKRRGFLGTLLAAPFTRLIKPTADPGPPVYKKEDNLYYTQKGDDEHLILSSEDITGDEDGSLEGFDWPELLDK